MSKKFLIWESNPFYSDEELKELKVECEMEDYTEQEFQDYLVEMNNCFHDDEMANLNIQVSGKILILADIGRWNGRSNGYKIIGTTVNEILRGSVNGYSEFEVYGDGYNILGKEFHHDGTNRYIYRVLREDTNYQTLLDTILNGKEITNKMLNRYTRSLYPYVASVYGWPCRQKKLCV